MSRIHIFGQDDDRWDAFLNGLGAKGWELVSTTHKPVPWPDHTEQGDEYTLFFKRPKD
jgi:hypothetical protein